MCSLPNSYNLLAHPVSLWAQASSLGQQHCLHFSSQWAQTPDKIGAKTPAETSLPILLIQTVSPIKAPPGLWPILTLDFGEEPKWHSNRPTVKSIIKKMEEWPLKKQHKAKEVSQNKGGNEENTWEQRHQGCSDREDVESEHRSREQGQQLKQRQKDVGRANTSKERVCKKPLAAKESQAITAAVFLLPIPCAFLDGPPSLRTSWVA